MITTVQKWGNSLAVRIPKSVAVKYRFDLGKSVEFVPRGDELLLRSINIPVPSLTKMARLITKKNRHHLTEWLGSKPVGKEIW